LREMNINDYEAVMKLWKDTEGLGVSDADSRENIHRYLRRNSGMSFVARCGAEIVGTVLCGHDGRRGYLHHLAVRQDFRRQGLGRVLAERALEKLREEGMTKCHLFVLTRNEEGLNFWTGIGWHQREDIIIVSKSLTTNPDSPGCSC